MTGCSLAACRGAGIVADFIDEDAYRAYDQDDGHNRARAGLLPMTEQIARIQFEMP